MLRLELLNLKADLERELGTFSLTCRAGSLDVYWGAGIGRPARTLGAPGARAARRAGGQGPDGTPAAGVRSPYEAGFDDP